MFLFSLDIWQANGSSLMIWLHLPMSSLRIPICPFWASSTFYFLGITQLLSIPAEMLSLN